MKNNITKLIDSILSESSVDPRIENGIFDIHNFEHMQIMAEHMKSHGVDSGIISEVIDGLAVDEGKHPERQAYNKDGWLVTFPSAEYKQNAIKKGTHYSSDPTHGKGGMNLYYKKRGKQKRQVQQKLTTTSPEDPNMMTVPSKKPVPVKPPTSAPVASDKTTTPDKKTAPTPEPEEYADDYTATDAASETEKLKKAFGDSWAKEKKQKMQPAEMPNAQAAVPVATPTELPNYAKVSKQFAINKGWTATPYGEWRDRTGNTMAVSGLSGEVVPIQNTDREELKIAIEKS